MQVSECIEKIKHGSREEIKEAKKELEKRKLLNLEGEESEQGNEDLEQFIEEMDKFDDEFKEREREAAFIYALKTPIFVLSEKYFEKFASFLLATVQDKSGIVRKAAVSTARDLSLNLFPLEEDDEFFSKVDRRSRQEVKEWAKRNQNRLGWWAFQTEMLVKEYEEPRFRKYKYISSLPSSVYKSLQQMMTEAILFTEMHEQIYENWYKRRKEEFGKQKQKLSEEESRAPQSDSKEEQLRWADKAESFLRGNEEFAPGRAVTVMKRFIENYPDEPWGHYLLGVARMKACKFHLAHEALTQALRLDPDNLQNIRTLGHIKVMLGEVEEGRRLIREAISRDTMFADAYTDLAHSYAEQYEFDKALEFFETARALSQDAEFVKKNINNIRDAKQNFDSMSEEDKRRALAEANNPQAKKHKCVYMLQHVLKQRPLVTEDELNEVYEELERVGVDVSVGAVPDTKIGSENN